MECGVRCSVYRRYSDYLLEAWYLCTIIRTLLCFLHFKSTIDLIKTFSWIEKVSTYLGKVGCLLYTT